MRTRLVELSAVPAAAVLVPIAMFCLMAAGMMGELSELHAQIHENWSFWLWLIYLSIVVSAYPQFAVLRFARIKSRAVFLFVFIVAAFCAALILVFSAGFLDNFGAYTHSYPSYAQFLTGSVEGIGKLVFDLFYPAWFVSFCAFLLIGFLGTCLGHAYWRIAAKVRSRYKWDLLGPD